MAASIYVEMRKCHSPIAQGREKTQSPARVRKKETATQGFPDFSGMLLRGQGDKLALKCLNLHQS